MKAKAGPQRGYHTKPNFWDLSRKLPMPGIDPGVRFFVWALNYLGMPTSFSCEGHPSGFYVTFTATYPQALRIKNAGFFGVEIESDGYWSIRINYQEGPREHVDHLRWATGAWIERLLPKGIIDQTGAKA